MATTAVVAPLAAPAQAKTHRARGDVRVFAHVASPGEPSFSLVANHRVYVGTFEDVEGNNTDPSKVFAYDFSGRLRRTYTVRGQTPGKPHGIQVAQRDGAGRLYLLDQAPARVVVLNPRTGRQRTWARFPDVPVCTSATTTQCSNTASDNPPEPDYAAWLPGGAMLVSDYAQQLIWRIPAHAHGVRTARVWLNDKRLDGEEFGPAGLVLMPGHHSLLLTVATGGITSTDPANNSTQGRLYRIGLTARFHYKSLTRLWSSEPGEAPDGFAVSRRHEHVYMAMAGPTGNSVVEVVHKSGSWQRVWQVPSSPTHGGSSPRWDTATSVSFLGTRLLVTNQAYFTDNAADWVLWDVESGERGMPIYVPRRAGR